MLGIAGSQSSIQSAHEPNLSRVQNNSFYSINSRNPSYTEQLKSLLNGHHSSSSSSAALVHSSPLSISTQHVSASSSSIIKFPLNSGSVTQLSDRKDHKPLLPPQRLAENDNKTTQSTPNITERHFPPKIELNLDNNISTQTINEHFYDLPTPPAIESLPTEFNTASSPLPSPPSSLNQTTISIQSRVYKPFGPQFMPKPVLKRHNSNEQDILIINKNNEPRIFKGINRSSSCVQANTGNQNPLVINELSSILARQKKKIEDATGEYSGSTVTVSSQHNSPKVAKKPPPPPRTDRSQLSRKQSLENSIY